MGLNVAQVVRHWALRAPQRVALVHLEGGERREVCFAELDARARRAAQALITAGVTPGARVLLSARNGLGFVDAWFGGLYAGASLLPVPPMSAAPELRFRIQHAGCSMVLGDEGTRALCAEAVRGLAAVRHLEVDALQDGTTAAEPPLDLPPESVAMMLYTSGTTGSPKAAMISHASLLTHTAALVHHVLRLSADDVVMAALPFAHSYGIRMTLLAPFYAGARAVVTGRFSAPDVLAALEREAVTWFPGVPTMFHALGHDIAPREGQGALRWCLSAGAPLPEEVRTRAEQVLRAPVRQGYGMTEATFTSVAVPEDPPANGHVGRPVFGLEVRIVGGDGQPVAPGTPGEICVRGQNVMLGYYADEQASQHALRGGFMHSGDIGYLDDDGYLYVVDRIKDMIIRGGFNVYPAEVEAVLVTHPAVRDAVVVGVPDERYGEEVAAIVVPAADSVPDPAALDAFCRHYLSRTKVPRLLGQVQALPVGPSGKVLRRRVREDAREGHITLQPLPPTSPASEDR